jgi:type I restriction enzyme S subunit
MVGTTQVHIRNGDFLGVPIPLPPLPEQRRIAEILDKADALRAQRRAAIAQFDTLTQSVFLDMFGDPDRNPKGWPKVRVGNLAKQIRGVTYGKEDATVERKPGYVPILRAGNISAGDVLLDDLVFVPAARMAQNQRLRRNDILIAASSGSLDVVGKAARVEQDIEAGFGAFCKVLRPSDGIDPDFFAAFFATQHYRRRVSELAAGVNIHNLRSEHLDDFPMPVPPDQLQRVFAASAVAVRGAKTAQRASLSDLDALLLVLQHRAFRGEL